MKNAIKSIQPTRLTQYDDNSSPSITTGTRGVLNRKNIDVSNKIKIHSPLISGENIKLSNEKPTKINIAIFGHGTVGRALIRQIIESRPHILARKNLDLNIFAVANSEKIWLDTNGISDDWETKLSSEGQPYSIAKVLRYAHQHALENLIAVDNTDSESFVDNYFPLIKGGFDLVSSNKIGNALTYEFYSAIRDELKIHKKEYRYEANVGAGLPLIDTIRVLHLSGENITKIQGVFSGSLSYIFNRFSESNQSFSSILSEAMKLGLTEPDPRLDLSGADVGRKLLILARELDLKNEMEDIRIQNLIPEGLRDYSLPHFLYHLNDVDSHFETIRKKTRPDHVLKYVASLSEGTQMEKGKLQTGLIEVPLSSPLGLLKGSDNYFEIYTESYGNNPIIIQGAGAGANVTARGVFGDILKIADR